MNPIPSDASQHFAQNMGQGQMMYPNGILNRSLQMPAGMPPTRFTAPSMPLGAAQGNPLMMPPVGNRAPMSGLPSMQQRTFSNQGMPSMRMNMMNPMAMPNSNVGANPPPGSGDLMAVLNKEMPDYQSLSAGYMYPHRTTTPNSSSQNEFTMHSEDFPALPGSNPSSSGREPGAGLSRTSSAPMGNFKQVLPPSQSPAPSDHVDSSSLPMQSHQYPIPTHIGIRPEKASPNDELAKQFQDQKMKAMSQAPDRFGLLGLLNVIRMSEQDLSTLAIGSDLTTLGLNLNSPECLYSTFASPWTDTPSRKEPEYKLPSCYYLQPPLALPAASKIPNLHDDALFYIFYSMPKETLQDQAAHELFNRGWRYHKELKVWLTRDPSAEVIAKTATYERGTYIYFDVSTWEKIQKEFVLMYDQLEERGNSKHR